MNLTCCGTVLGSCWKARHEHTNIKRKPLFVSIYSWRGDCNCLLKRTENFRYASIITLWTFWPEINEIKYPIHPVIDSSRTIAKRVTAVTTACLQLQRIAVTTAQIYTQETRNVHTNCPGNLPKVFFDFKYWCSKLYYILARRQP